MSGGSSLPSVPSVMLPGLTPSLTEYRLFSSTWVFTYLRRELRLDLCEQNENLSCSVDLTALRFKLDWERIWKYFIYWFLNKWTRRARHIIEDDVSGSVDAEVTSHKYKIYKQNSTSYWEKRRSLFVRVNDLTQAWFNIFKTLLPKAWIWESAAFLAARWCSGLPHSSNKLAASVNGCLTGNPSRVFPASSTPLTMK